jgi:hypothetical protein
MEFFEKSVGQSIFMRNGFYDQWQDISFLDWTRKNSCFPSGLYNIFSINIRNFNLIYNRAESKIKEKTAGSSYALQPDRGIQQKLRDYNSH